MFKRISFLALFLLTLVNPAKSYCEQTVFIFMGAPGAGKGVLCKKLSRGTQLPHISTGDLLRRAQNNENSPLSIELVEYMSEGQLVPDEVIAKILARRIKESDCQKGFILDGFPRTVNQAKMLDKILAKDHNIVAVNLLIEEEVVINRLLGRRTCPNCRESYHLDYMPPKKEGICDECGHNLTANNDDCEAAIRNRLVKFNDEFEPIRDYYKASHKWVEINTQTAVGVSYALLLEQLHGFDLENLVLSTDR
ncbi:MAG: adenylate kinase [Chlamydiae bacterium]|nr:adenylate kinase [Chlamydiota bacterium]